MVDFKSDERLNTLNHSCAHVMAQAVKHLYPEAKFWVGPVVKEGFYYDIDLGENAVNDDVIAAIEKEMKKICKEGKKIYRREISKAEALELFKNDEYKLDLISDLEDGTISVYDQGDFTDLCRGPHVDNTKLCKNFKLVKYSGVYWKGDANNHVMQRMFSDSRGAGGTSEAFGGGKGARSQKDRQGDAAVYVRRSGRTRTADVPSEGLYRMAGA